MRKPKDKRRYLRQKADKLWQEVIKKLHPRCEYCDRNTEVGHHFIPCSLSNALRYDIQNGIGLCKRCHYLWHNRADGSIYARIVLNRGYKWATYIDKNKRKLVKITIKWYEAQIKKLQKQLNG